MEVHNTCQSLYAACIYIKDRSLLCVNVLLEGVKLCWRGCGSEEVWLY